MDDELCLACDQTPDHCQGGHGQPCTECRGWAGSHVWSTSNMAGNRVCQGCGLLPVDGDDDELPCPAGGAHEPNCPLVEDRPWVSVYWEQGHEAITILRDQSVRAAREYMEQWDYGDETDAAHTYEPPAPNFLVGDTSKPWGANDTLYEDGQYVIAVGPSDYYISMYRRAPYVRQ